VLDKESQICPECSRRIARITEKDLSYSAAGYMEGFCPYCDYNIYTMSVNKFPRERLEELISIGKKNRWKRASYLEKLSIPFEDLMFKNGIAFIIMVLFIAFSFFGLADEIMRSCL
jgi:hypothetical protein